MGCCSKRIQREEDIFSADQTKLFFKISPNVTSKFKNWKCVRYQNRGSLVCANAMSPEKQKLMVTGKSQKPCCCNNVKKPPVKYSGNNKA